MKDLTYELLLSKSRFVAANHEKQLEIKKEKLLVLVLVLVLERDLICLCGRK